ncbi:MAG: cytochrome c biogenesis protein CcsA [Alphaproteobacteria bacterium]|nr:cytochrome c biogenesis protein CcsA [Alphaproteobacteria bacterium]
MSLFGNSLLVNLSAVVSILPMALLAWRPHPTRDRRFWAAVAVAAIGAMGWTLIRFGDRWDGGLGAALWVSAATTVGLFAAISAASGTMARMAGLLGPYLLIVALLASVLDAPHAGGVVGMPEGWVVLHIMMSLATYALATLAAVAGVGVFLKERALKAKKPFGISAALPAVTDAETLLFRLLTAAEVVLGAGILSGIALNVTAGHAFISSDHKSILSLVAFLVVGAVLIAHSRLGLRGRRAARGVLAVYLLLTLAYPGVKAVHALLGT